ncbi:MAG: DNA polymerase III subunit delta [Alphaproteobacteria bacterium]|nr:DNA polymerase III subunit delta [Alphaproteobacteria bacterium]MCL2890112.1 DNA polymerase III subunit delta [Alphaproteobacteria bacterium]
MKWKESDFNNSLSRQMSGVPAILIYGPDAGLVDEMADKVSEKLEIDSLNMFVIDADDLRAKMDTVFAEACSPSLLGGRRLVWVAGAGDSDAPIIRELCEHSGLDAFVVITGGELRGGGGLRSLFENHDKLAALACYADDDRTLGNVIRESLFASGIKQIEPDAMQYMFARLGVDRGVTRSFLKKLALYVDDKKTVSLDDVEKCLPDSGAVSIDDFMYSLTAGHITATMTALDRVFFDGAEPIMLVRMLDSHFKKLLGAVSGGAMPKLFWKVAEKFNTATRIWPEDEIVAVLTRLNELELQTKSSGLTNMSELLIRDFALKLSVRAAKLAIKARGK